MPQKSDENRGTLVLLGASWCPPCLDELRAVAYWSSKLQAMQIDVVALSIDDFTQENGSLEQAQAFLEDIGFPFRSGVAQPELVDVLQAGHDFLFELHEPLPLPSRVLLGGGGALEGMFKGPLDVQGFLKQTLQVARMPPIGLKRRNFSLPFRGRWLVQGAMRESIGGLAAQFYRRGYLDLGQEYLKGNQALLQAGPDYGSVRLQAAQALQRAGRYEEAVEHYQAALSTQPGNIQVMGSLARLYAACPDDRIRQGKQALELAQRAAQWTPDDFAILEVLALAQAELGQFHQAERTATRAMRLAEKNNQIDLVQTLQRQIARFRAGQRVRLPDHSLPDHSLPDHSAPGP